MGVLFEKDTGQRRNSWLARVPVVCLKNNKQSRPPIRFSALSGFAGIKFQPSSLFVVFPKTCAAFNEDFLLTSFNFISF